jgi:hypothetical protein
MESFREVSLHLEPLALMTDPAAPGANPHQALKVMEVVHQSFGKAEDNGPNINDYEGFRGGIAPISFVSSSPKQELRQSFNFVYPGERDYQQKSDTFIP